MQYQTSKTLLLAVLATLASSSPYHPRTPLQPRDHGIDHLSNVDMNKEIDLDPKIAASLAGPVFNAADTGVISLVSDNVLRRQTIPEPDANRTIITPPLIFTLQCTDAGFRGNCLVFGAPSGSCVSYFDFQQGNDTTISDTYNDQVSSISSNTGGKCQYYLFLGCDNKGDDRGVTIDYNYDLSVRDPDDDRVIHYENQITSWRC